MTLIDESTRIDKKVIHKELSFAIMETAFEVHNTLSPGYSEGIQRSVKNSEIKTSNTKDKNS